MLNSNAFQREKLQQIREIKNQDGTWKLGIGPNSPLRSELQAPVPERPVHPKWPAWISTLKLPWPKLYVSSPSTLFCHLHWLCKPGMYESSLNSSCSFPHPICHRVWPRFSHIIPATALQPQGHSPNSDHSHLSPGFLRIPDPLQPLPLPPGWLNLILALLFLNRSMIPNCSCSAFQPHPS